MSRQYDNSINANMTKSIKVLGKVTYNIPLVWQQNTSQICQIIIIKKSLWFNLITCVTFLFEQTGETVGIQVRSTDKTQTEADYQVRLTRPLSFPAQLNQMPIKQNIKWGNIIRLLEYRVYVLWTVQCKTNHLAKTRDINKSMLPTSFMYFRLRNNHNVWYIMLN